MDEKKKIEEKIVVRHFLDIYEDAPSGKLISHESPDFILKPGKRFTIGIEITRITDAFIADEFDKIQEAVEMNIQKKNEKLKNYRKKRLNEYWLLIVAEDMDIVHFQKLEDYLMRMEFKSDFTKTFLFDLFTDKIYSL